MKSVRLRPRAIADLAEIRRYTQSAWGKAQAREYLAGLGRRFEAIAAGTAATRSAADAGPEFRRCRYGRHLIFFVEEAETIRIVRILHDAMNSRARLRKD